MTQTGVTLSLILIGPGVIFGVFAVLFAVKKDSVCRWVGGFNFFTPAQQARYDQTAIARDYSRLMGAWSMGAFVFSALCLWLAWWAFGTALALFLISVVKVSHIDAEKAFEKYKIKQ